MNAAEILGYGAIGLGFLLAYLAYRLLQQIHRLKSAPPDMIRSTYTFMVFCLLLVLIGAFLQYSDSKASAMVSDDQSKIAGLQASIDGANRSIERVMQLLDGAQKALVAQMNFAQNDGCPGGPHGYASSHAGDIAQLNASISSDLANARGILDSAKK